MRKACQKRLRTYIARVIFCFARVDFEREYMPYKKCLFLLTWTISVLIISLLTFKNYLSFYCNENFAYVYLVNIFHASELIDSGDYDGALGMLDGLKNTYHEQKRCGASDVGSVLTGAAIQVLSGNSEMVNDSDRFREIEYLKRKAINRKMMSNQETKDDAN